MCTISKKRSKRAWWHLPPMASFRWLLQLHRDVPRAARFYSEGLDFSINVCTLRWAELQSGSLKLALMQSSSNVAVQKGYSSMLSFTVTDINSTMTKLMALGAELDGPVKYEIHGKVCKDTLCSFTNFLDTSKFQPRYLKVLSFSHGFSYRLLPCDASMATWWVSMSLHDGNTSDGELFNIGTRIPQLNILDTKVSVALHPPTLLSSEVNALGLPVQIVNNTGAYRVGHVM